MIFLALLGFLVVAWFLARRARRRANREAAVRPLAGLDTGSRSAFRVPSRFFNHRRGF